MIYQYILLLIKILFCLAIIVSPFLIVPIKKRRHLGNLWSGHVSAELSISNKKLCCKHCEHTEFHKREGVLVTSWLAFFRLSFWNRSAACYTCINCGSIEWFVQPKETHVKFKHDETINQ